jgi:hypothetical protein
VPFESAFELAAVRVEAECCCLPTCYLSLLGVAPVDADRRLETKTADRRDHLK